MAFTVNEAKVIKLTSGEEITLPRMTLGKILAVTNAISTLVKAVKKEYPDLFKDSEVDVAALGLHIIRCLPEMLPVIGDQIVGVIATYIGKESKWVMANMDIEDLVNVATPFLQITMQQGNHLLGAINKGFASVQPPENSRRETERNIAGVIDWLAYTYGWSVKDIIDLTLDDVKLMQSAAIKRHKAEEKAIEDAKRGKKRPIIKDEFDDEPPPRLSEDHLNSFKKFGQLVEEG
jgi:hypothetical protein